jgi:hypothetical protein
LKDPGKRCQTLVSSSSRPPGSRLFGELSLALPWRILPRADRRKGTLAMEIATLISALSALFTAAAALAAWRSANAARDTARILREEREDVVRQRMVAPLLEIRDLLALYTMTVNVGEEGGQTAKGIQRQIKWTLRRSSAIAERHPKLVTFAGATQQEVKAAEEAFDEVEAAIERSVNEGETFGLPG